MQTDSPVTELLSAWRNGDRAALDRMIPVVYEQLHRIASGHLRRERSDHTIQSTALINEAFIALSSSKVSLNDRIHFFAVASNTMRRILIDHARAAARQKRGGGALHVTLHEAEIVDPAGNSTILELDTALTQLEQLDERKSRIIEMHYFGGLSYEEIAQVLEISPATVNRELRFSKAWLRRVISDEANGGEDGR